MNGRFCFRMIVVVSLLSSMVEPHLASPQEKGFMPQLTVRSKEGAPLSLVYSRDARLLAAGTEDGDIQLWDATTGRLLRVINGAHENDVVSVAFNSSADRLASVGKGESSVSFWNVRSLLGEERAEVDRKSKNLVASQADVKKCKAPVNGIIGATGTDCWVGSDQGISDGPDKRVVFNARQLRGFSLSPNFDRIAIADDAGVSILDVRGKNVIATIQERPTGSPSFSNDGTMVAAPFNDTVQVFEANSGKVVHSYKASGAVNDLAWLTGDVLVAAAIGHVNAWDTRTDSSVLAAQSNQPIHGLACHPQRPLFATGSADQSIKIWSTTRHRIVASLYAMPRAESKATPGNSERDYDFSAMSSDEVTFVLRQFGLPGTPEDLIRRVLPSEVSSVLGRLPIRIGRKRRSTSTSGSQDKGWQPSYAPTEWAAVTSEGYYDSSLGASHQMQWMVNGKETQSNQLEGRYKRPSVVQQALTDEGELPSGELKYGPLPQLRLVSPREGQMVTGDTVVVTAQLDAEKGRDLRMDIFADGPVRAIEEKARAIEEKARDIDQLTFQEEVQLPPGRSKVTLRAVIYDATREQRSLPAEVTIVRADQKEDASQGKLYVLSVGVSEYKNSAYNLRYAADDAREFAKKLEEVGHGSVQSKLLVDREATASNVRLALKDLKQATEHDTIAVFIAGHGVRDGDAYYFATHEIDLGSLTTTALSWEDLVAVFRQDVRAKCTVMFADTCHAGGVVGHRQASTDALAEALRSSAGVAVFAACGREERSFENDEWKHGAFTYSLLAGLNGEADVDKNREISLLELALYVSRRVDLITSKQQHPHLIASVDGGTTLARSK